MENVYIQVPDRVIKVIVSGGIGPQGNQGIPGVCENVQITFTSGFNFEYALSGIPFSIKNCTFFNESGDEISVSYQVSDKLYIESNIDLENHKVIIT